MQIRALLVILFLAIWGLSSVSHAALCVAGTFKRQSETSGWCKDPRFRTLSIAQNCDAEGDRGDASITAEGEFTVSLNEDDKFSALRFPDICADKDKSPVTGRCSGTFSRTQDKVDTTLELTCNFGCPEANYVCNSRFLKHDPTPTPTTTPIPATEGEGEGEIEDAIEDFKETEKMVEEFEEPLGTITDFATTQGYQNCSKWLCGSSSKTHPRAARRGGQSSSGQRGTARAGSSFPEFR